MSQITVSLGKFCVFEKNVCSVFNKCQLVLLEYSVALLIFS